MTHEAIHHGGAGPGPGWRHRLQSASTARVGSGRPGQRVSPSQDGQPQAAWNDVEEYCRHVVTKEGHRLYIVCGPAGKGGAGKDGPRDTIGGGRVTVPAKCWKVVLVIPEGGDKDDIDKVFARTRLIAII